MQCRTCVLNDQHHIVDEVVGPDDVHLGVLVVGDGELPDGEVEAPGRAHDLPSLLHHRPGGLPEPGALAVQLVDGVRSLLQGSSVDHQNHPETEGEIQRGESSGGRSELAASQDTTEL